MELFKKSKVIRLRSHHEKYLIADDDAEDVDQDRNGTIKNARWTVELTQNSNAIRLKSCYGKYLTATNIPFLLGMTGKKVLQTLPRKLDSSTEWEPIRDGGHFKLKTRYGQYLRANCSLPPWRNHITHDIPHRTATQDWILWNIDIVAIRVEHTAPLPPPTQFVKGVAAVHSNRPVELAPSDEPVSPPSISLTSSESSELEIKESKVSAPIKNGGRTIHYSVANENGDIDENKVLCLKFKGSVVEELKDRLEEETGLNDILVCSRNPLNGKLYPLRLQLPPNNISMHLVVVPSPGKAASNIGNPDSPSVT